MITQSNNLQLAYFGQPQTPIDESLVFYAPLDRHRDTAVTGQTLSVYGTESYSVLDGIPCLVHARDANFWIASATTLTTQEAWTLSAWICQINISGETWLFGPNDAGSWGHGMHLYINKTQVGLAHGGGNTNVFTANSYPTRWKWFNLVARINVADGPVELYVDGVQIASNATAGTTYQKKYTQVRFCTDYSGNSRGVNGTYAMAACRIYNRALSQDEITALAHEFTPTT